MPRQGSVTDSTPSTTPTLSYEQAMAELEGLVQRIEAGQMPLDQMLDSYKRGAELLALCRSRLAAVEQQVKVLDEGQLKAWNPPSP
jgi:exodeoxyribonuclease VII small subunit